MLKSIFNSVAGHYDAETKKDIVKIIGLHLFILLGVVVALYLFGMDLLGFSPDQCLPGDTSLLVIFGLSFYGLRNIRLSWAVNAFLMIPLVAYFYFIAPAHSIFPNHLSVPFTLWTLIPFMLLFLLFSENQKSLSIFYLLSCITLLTHVYVAGLSDWLFDLKWAAENPYYNPFLVLSAFYLAALLIAWNFHHSLEFLRDKKKNTDKMITQTVRNLSHGVMLLELKRDEFQTPTHLMVRKTNLAFERLFNITSREIKDQNAVDVFPKIFRDSFDWSNQYFHSRKKHLSFYLSHLDRHFEVETFKLTNDKMVSLFTDVSAQRKLNADLAESKKRYQVLLEAVPDLFFIIDREGTYVDFVFKASEALKIKPEDIIGSSIFEFGFS